MKYAVLCILGLSLAACNQTTSEMGYAEKKQLVLEKNKYCAQIAGDTGSPAWKSCMDSELRAYDAKTLKTRAALAAIGDGMASAGASMQQNYNSYRPRTCSSYVSGSYINTSCY